MPFEVLSEPPDRPVCEDVVGRRALSAPAGQAATPNDVTSDGLSGFGSTTKESTPDDALSLDEDSEGAQPTVLHPPAAAAAAKGFLLPRSPARLFVHNSVVQSALQQIASHNSSTESSIHPESIPATVVNPAEEMDEMTLTTDEEDLAGNVDDSGVCDVPVGGSADEYQTSPPPDEPSSSSSVSLSGGYHTPGSAARPAAGESFIKKAAAPFLVQQQRILSHLYPPRCLAGP